MYNLDNKLLKFFSTMFNKFQCNYIEFDFILYYNVLLAEEHDPKIILTLLVQHDDIFNKQFYMELTCINLFLCINCSSFLMLKYTVWSHNGIQNV